MVESSAFFTDLFVFKYMPRYKSYIFEQIRDQFIANIENGVIGEDTLLPSINNFSKEYGLSKVTVGRAYLHLKYKGYISYVQGQGYFVVRSKPKLLRILFLFSRLDDEVLMFHRGMLEGLDNQARFDLQSYHADAVNLYELVEKSKKVYDHLLFMPRYEEREWFAKLIHRMPSNKSVFLKDRILGGDILLSGLLQNSETDFHIALEQAEDQVSFYTGITILANIENYQSLSIINAVRLFCDKRTISYQVLRNITQSSVSKGQLYIVCEDEDLVKLIRKVQLRGIEPGGEIGIISIREKAWKELLNISVFNADFASLGRKIALSLSGRECDPGIESFHMIRRKSF